MLLHLWQEKVKIMCFKFLDNFDYLTDGEIELRISGKYSGNEKFLPFYYYDIFLKDRFIGKISMRIGKNFNSYYNGNIGYEIEETFRGNNFSFKACKLVLTVAKAHGMNEITLSCDEDNIASYKTIEKLGSKLVEITKPPETYFAYRNNMKNQRIYKLYLEK